MGTKNKTKTNVLKMIFANIKGYWRDTIFTWALVLIESVCEVLVAYFMQYLLDSVKAVSDSAEVISDVYMYAIIIACLAIVAVLTGIFAGFFAASAAAGFGANLRKSMYERIQDYSFHNIDKFSTPSIITRTTTDVANVQNAFLQIIRAVIRAPFLIVFAFIMCFITEWKLAWVFLAIVPFLAAGMFLIANKTHPTFVKVFRTYDNLNEEVHEDVDGMRVVKSFNREDSQKEKFGKVSEFIYKNFIKAERLIALNMPLMNCAVYVAILLVSYFGANLIVNSGGTDLSIGGYSTLITYIMIITMALMLLSMVYVTIIIARNSSERISEIIDEKPDICSPENSVATVPNGSVSFNNVSFAYNPGKYVLKDINLSFDSGSSVGIIGSTGSSKTTLVSLIDRLYDVTDGVIEVGGVDVKEYDLKVLRDNVSIVLQKNTLFTGTIRENLKWGNPNATDDEIMIACNIAQATEFIDALPQGLDSLLVEGGSNLSGGQKQRLCIARALLKNPKILILDDSTSACDTHTDFLIRENLRNYRTNMTTFIISQRVLSIEDCEQIIVMDKGLVIAHGSNSHLLKNCDVYRELSESQMAGGDFDARS